MPDGTLIDGPALGAGALDGKHVDGGSGKIDHHPHRRIGGGTAWAYNTTVEAFDSRYVTIAGLQKLFNDRDLKILKKQIKEYEWLKNHGGGLTERQEWELGEMYDELEEMTE